jgi:O-antigen ligase
VRTRPRFLSRLAQTWRHLLDLAFALLCMRFLFAASHDADWTFQVIGLASFGVAWWNPSASLFAFVLGLSLLGGLQQTVLFTSYSVLLVVISSTWLGLWVRQLYPSPKKSPIEAAKAPFRLCDGITLLIELLATAALLFLLIQIWQHRAIPDFWPRFWQQSRHGPTDPFYFLSSAFLWLHGLFFFRAVRRHSGSGLLAPEGVQFALLTNSVVLLVFFALQLGLDLPARWVPGFQSPYEDIATFGIMATCLLIFNLVSLRRGLSRALLSLHGSLAVGLVAAVVGSWSRGTWLVAAVFISLLALLRLPRHLAAIIFGLLLGGIVFVNLNSGRPRVAQGPYWDRLASLVRLENPDSKSRDRIELYYKGLAMVRERPWTGHGIGTFYERETRYARPGDPWATLPQLPHNLLLQLATEQGLVIASLFAFLMGATLWLGTRQWLVASRDIAADPDRLPGGKPGSPSPVVLGLTAMIAAYLQANLTWDILTVHATQPWLFFFFLSAFLLFV